MANKLAGQRAKFTKALADYNKTDDEEKKLGAARRTAQVLWEAPRHGFTETGVRQGEEVPSEVRRLVEHGGLDIGGMSPDDPDQRVRELQQTVDASELQEMGKGSRFVYAYGYRCAPDRLKVSRTKAEVTDRIARQISTGTPDKPALFLIIRNDHCVSLEKAMQGVLEIRGRKVIGGGDECYFVTRDELVQVYQIVSGPDFQNLRTPR
jgi:hypothetical protein